MNFISKRLAPHKKVYFVSDSHLGIPDYKSSLKREKLLVEWLDTVSKDADEIYLLGDIFDFWFEYKYVVPRGYVRLFGKIAELTDAGLTINYFTGNHDMWIRDYFRKELGLRIYKKPINCQYNKHFFHIGHGDGLGPGDRGYKFLKVIFSNSFCKWLFARLHPNFAFWLALFFSLRSRLARGASDLEYLGPHKERLIQYSKDMSKEHGIDFFVFGHRHLPIDIKLNEKARYLNAGDWFNHFSYIEYDGEDIRIKKFKD